MVCPIPQGDHNDTQHYMQQRAHKTARNADINWYRFYISLNTK